MEEKLNALKFLVEDVNKSDVGCVADILIYTCGGRVDIEIKTDVEGMEFITNRNSKNCENILDIAINHLENILESGDLFGKND
jgi:hypothetical protein